MKTQNKEIEIRFWDNKAEEGNYLAFTKEEYKKVFNYIEKPNQKILDVGCANGFSSELFVKEGHEVIGIDISPKLIKRAKELWENNHKMVFIVGDAENLNIPNESIDIVFCGGVIHHFPNYMNVLKETKRILKRNGKFIFLEPNSLDIFEKWDFQLAKQKISPNEKPINPLKLKKDLQTLGFVDIKIEIFRKEMRFLKQVKGIDWFFKRRISKILTIPILSIINLFRNELNSGNFFLITGVKEK